VETQNPEIIAQHPSVEYYEEEVWKDIHENEVKLYRFELTDYNAYLYIRKKAKVVNELPTVMAQTLYRLKAYPFRKVRIEGGKVVEVFPEEFPKITYATVTTVDWFGPSYYGKEFIANVNGVEIKEKVGEFDLAVDVAECFGIACHKVKSSVLIKRKRAPVSVKGLIEWSLTTKTPIRELEDSTIGKALTTNEAWVALKRKVIVPGVVPRVEKLRTVEQLKEVDKGGLIVFPKVGAYNQVYQLDFSSMYPSLIVKYNISFDTVDKCDDVVTEIGHSICMKEKGIVPEALEWLVKRKEELKRIDEERAEAIKWILVASFGYLGYRNSKFGKIEAYELVTYFARKTLREAIELAKKYKVEVLHGIIDSLIVKGDNVKEFSEAIERLTGLKMKVEEMDWVILFPRRDGMPYPMRYLAKRKDGEVKAKGLIRSNMPNVVKEFLERAVKAMGKAKKFEEIDLNEIKEIKKELEERIIEGKERADFVIWVKDRPLVRGVRGFYDAREGYKGRDVGYYLDYLEREYEVLVNAIHGIRAVGQVN
jgi:DNA polymerase I